MSAFQSAYNLGRSPGTCHATGRELTPGESYVAALIETDGEELERLDFSREAWDERPRPARLFGFWRAVRAEPGEQPRPLIDDESLLDLFEQLNDADVSDRRRLAFRYVLALMLVRKRLARHVRTIRADGGADLVVALRGPAGWDDAIESRVTDPQLDEAMIRDVTERIGALIDPEGSDL